MLSISKELSCWRRMLWSIMSKRHYRHYPILFYSFILYCIILLYFVNKPFPWYVVLSYTSPRLRNCPKSEQMRTIWKPRDCINSIQHTTEVVYSFYDSTIIFHHKQTNQRRRRRSGSSTRDMSLIFVTSIN